MVVVVSDFVFGFSLKLGTYIVYLRQDFLVKFNLKKNLLLVYLAM